MSSRSSACTLHSIGQQFCLSAKALCPSVCRSESVCNCLSVCLILVITTLKMSSCFLIIFPSGCMPVSFPRCKVLGRKSVSQTCMYVCVSTSVSLFCPSQRSVCLSAYPAVCPKLHICNAQFSCTSLNLAFHLGVCNFVYTLQYGRS